jgi:hypothetical protein
LTSIRVRTPSTRLSRAAALLLHLLLMVAAPLAEARAQKVDFRLHVESENTETCPPAHNHLLCPTCRHLEARFTPASSSGRLLQEHVVSAAEPAVPAAAEPTDVTCRALGPRAPPFA